MDKRKSEWEKRWVMSRNRGGGMSCRELCRGDPGGSHMLGGAHVVGEVPGASARAMGTREGARGLGARGHT